MEKQEIWKPIPINPKFMVSNMGRVRGSRGKVLKAWIGQTYLCFKISLMRESGPYQKTYYVHHAVAEAFIGPRPLGHYICHGDGNHLNNHDNNLRYDIPTGNSADQLKHGTIARGASLPQTKISDDLVIEIYKRCQGGEKTGLLAKEYGVSPSCISEIKHKTKRKHLFQ